MGSFEITLRAEHTPAFPPFCVSCGASEASLVTVRCRAQGGPFWRLLIGRLHETRVPACRTCALRVRWRPEVRWLMVWVGAFLALAFVLPLTAEGGRSIPVIGPLLAARHMRKWTCLGAAALGGVVSWVLFDTVMPVPLDVDPDDDKKVVTYSFRNATYAAAFALLNEAGEVDPA